MKNRTLWAGFAIISINCFCVLIYFGHELYRQKPPIPEKVISASGTVLFTSVEIKDGQNVWQSIGGQEVGTVWGHGAYVAPDWSADWLHKEILFLLNKWSQKEFNAPYDNLQEEQKAMLKERVQ